MLVVHTLLLLVQATSLSVAINSYNNVLITIMVSNNFVELKGSVFKKFETNNLFQMACSGKCLGHEYNTLYCCSDFTDIRERFHYVVLLGTVLIGNLKQFNWNAGMEIVSLINFFHTKKTLILLKSQFICF